MNPSCNSIQLNPTLFIPVSLYVAAAAVSHVQLCKLWVIRQYTRRGLFLVPGSIAVELWFEFLVSQVWTQVRSSCCGCRQTGDKITGNTGDVKRMMDLEVARLKRVQLSIQQNLNWFWFITVLPCNKNITFIKNKAPWVVHVMDCCSQESLWSLLFDLHIYYIEWSPMAVQRAENQS